MKLLVFPYDQWKGKITGPKRRMVSLAKQFRRAKGMDVRAPPSGVQPIKFNPSITLLRKKSKSCVYAVAYRAHFPSPKGYRGSVPRLAAPRTDTPKGRVGMWDFQFRNYWDGTGICEIEVFDDKIVIRKDVIPMKGGQLLDPRIVRQKGKGGGGTLFLQYSDYTWGQEKWDVKPTEVLKRCGEYWDELCIMIGTVPIRLDSKEGFAVKAKGHLICQDTSRRFEKNWAFVPDGRKTKTFQYSCGPLTYMRGITESNSRECIEVKAKSTFFMRLYKHLGNLVPGMSGNGIACTSPLQTFGTSYIGLGHIKLLYKNFKPKSRKGAHRFIGELAKRQNLNLQGASKWFKEGINMHQQYIYVMFMYTINRKTLELERVSDAWLPQSGVIPYFSTLVFPMAIEPFLGSQWALSVGISDHDSALLIMSSEEIRTRLRHKASSPVQNMEFNIVEC